MKTTVQVKCLTKRIDWATGKNIIENVPFVVDSDMVSHFHNIIVRDLSKVPRDKRLHTHKPSYVMHSSGSSALVTGETSVASWVLGVQPGTRRKKGYDTNDFTREAYGL